MASNQEEFFNKIGSNLPFAARFTNGCYGPFATAWIF